MYLQFIGDANEVMQLLLKTHTDLPVDDPQLSYLISAWARLCKILGKFILFYFILFCISELIFVQYTLEMIDINEY